MKLKCNCGYIYKEKDGNILIGATKPRKLELINTVETKPEEIITVYVCPKCKTLIYGEED